ncbi:MAG TPA: tetratricopeptide repeat protein, partial [Kamptonema sp.]|nr:tetratricopeptide repeat protein [Kamptonema sp.]
MVHYQEVKLQELSEVEVFHLRYNAAGKWVLPVSVTSDEFVETSVTENEELSAGVRELTDKEIGHIRWAFYYLKIYEPQPTADNLEKVSHYLEAFHHFCELAAWEEAWQVLFIRCDTPTREELHIQLDTWGYYRLQIELYNQLLGKLDRKYRHSICYCGLGNAYRNLGDYRLAIEYHQKHLEIAREIGDRRGEANAGFNLGLALARVDEKWKAITAYENARNLFQAMGLEQYVEKCNNSIRDIGMKVV